jgi:hypothetical protein
VKASRIALAVAAGVVVGGLSFWHYAAPPGPAVSERDPLAHADHEPWYGGQLGMVGDDHIELVRSARGTEVYVSDAWRRPVQPKSAWIVVDGGPRIDLHPDDDDVETDAQLHGREATVSAVLPDGRRVEISFKLEP